MRVALLLLLLAGCGYRPGAVNTDTGLQGIAVAPGSLAGTWATMAEFDTIVPAGILGDTPGGWRLSLLVTRQWKSGAYLETLRRCGRDAFEVAGSKTTVAAATFPKLLPLSTTSHADHAQGSWSTEHVVELWGLQHLPDPEATPLPSQHDYQQAPQSDSLLDEDQDGDPAVTELSHGTVGGRMFEVERMVYTLEGTVTGPDRVQGLVKLLANQSNRLWATTGWLLGESVTRPDPGRVAWFDSARLKEGATCDDVAAAVAAGTVASSKPF